MKDDFAGVTIALCNAADIPPGEMRRYQPTQLPEIAIYNVGGKFYATEDLCTHGGASLTEEGMLVDHIVECGWHLGSFDVRTGEGVAAPCRRRLRTYRTIIVQEMLCLSLTPTQALEAGLSTVEAE